MLAYYMPEITDKTLSKLSPKDTVEAVFDGMGGVKNMTEWARANQSTFYVNLYGKLVAQSIDLNVKGNIRIDLPWLVSRPGRPPVTLENPPQEVLNAITDANTGAESVQVPAKGGIHSPPQPDPAVRVRSVSPQKRQNRRTGK